MEHKQFERPINEEVAKELREQLLPIVLDLMKQVSETDDGYVFDFGRDDEALEIAYQWVEIERKANPFLRMLLTSESNQGPIKLEIVGPSGTKNFLHTEFALSRWINPS